MSARTAPTSAREIRVAVHRQGRSIVAALSCAVVVMSLWAAAPVAANPIAAAPAASPVGAAPVVPHRACAAGHGRIATCFATYRSAGKSPRAAAAATPAGLGPADIRKAYRLPAAGAAHPTVAIVDAQDNPNAEKDLAVYRAHYGLPPCTSANGCFRKLNQQGKKSPLPEGDPGWGVEIALDLDAVSAACPQCSILLVEGTTASIDDLGTAVNTAVRLGAAVVSNSYGTAEFNGILSVGKKYYVHPGIPIVVSSGDDGFGIPQFPAVLATSVAVGGTTLTKTSTARGWTEQAWSGAGSGCSGYVAKPSWQHDTHCPTRTVADVSAVADPATGLAVYDTYGLGADNGYLQVGGTSLSAPLIAGMIALAGNASSISGARYIYQHRGSVNDVVGGSNGYCGDDYLCTGVKGYDAPSGVGSPNGLGAL